MELIVAVAARAALLVYCVVVPGLAVLRWTRFHSTSSAERVLACLAAGAAVTSLTVTTLLLVGLYYRPVLIVLLLAPAAYLVWTSRRLPHPTPNGLVAIATRFDAIDRAVVVACAGFLAVYLVDAWTSPITWWDGLASWGKWAADWGRRTSSANYVVGGYPQLVPRIVSVMYKLTGAHSQVLPLEFFALHGVYVLFAGWFLLAAVRLTTVLSMPAWPVVLAGLGSIQFREHSGAGTVDVLACALVTTTLALYFGLRQASWTAERKAVVLGGAAFAAIFTKWNGGIAIVLIVIFDRMARVALPVGADRQAAITRTVKGAITVAAVGMLPFVIEQAVSEFRIRQWRPDPFEVNISIRQMPTLLSTDANVVYRGGDAKAQASLVQLRFWNSYDVPASLRLLFTGFLAAALGAAAGSWFGRAVLPVIVIYGAIWLYWSSYDQRNIFVLLPIVALAVSVGTARLWKLWPGVVWKNAIAIIAGLFLILSGGGLLKDTQARLTSLKDTDTRLAAMRGSVADKVSRFFPQLEPDYQFLSALAGRTSASHVLVTYPLFRFFERGAHALSVWPYERVQAGDVFAGHEWHVPPRDPEWVYLARHGRNRIWLRTNGLAPVAPRAEEMSPPGVRRLLYDVPSGNLGKEGVVVWRAVIPHTSNMTAATFAAAPELRLDPTLVSTACTPPTDGTAGLECSGIVAVAVDAIGSYKAGMLRVGLVTDADPAIVTLSVARPLRPQDGPPQ